MDGERGAERLPSAGKPRGRGESAEGRGIEGWDGMVGRAGGGRGGRCRCQTSGSRCIPRSASLSPAVESEPWVASRGADDSTTAREPLQFRKAKWRGEGTLAGGQEPRAAPSGTIRGVQLPLGQIPEGPSGSF